MSRAASSASVASAACSEPTCLWERPLRLRMKTSHNGERASDMALAPLRSGAALAQQRFLIGQALPAEGIIAGTLISQMRKPRQRFRRGGNVVDRNPPHDEMRAQHRLEPVRLSLVETLVQRLPDEVLKLFGRLPHAHVDEIHGVRSDLDIGGVATVGLETPHEARAAFGERIDALKGAHELGHARILGRVADPADIELSKMR